jgi:hypothetical protein
MLVTKTKRAARGVLGKASQQHHRGPDLQHFPVTGWTFVEVELDRSQIVRPEIPINERADRVDIQVSRAVRRVLLSHRPVPSSE